MGSADAAELQAGQHQRRDRLVVVNRAAETAASLVGIKDHPFSLKKFKTDGKRIFADMEVTPDRVRELAVKLAERELGCELVEGARC